MFVPGYENHERRVHRYSDCGRGDSGAPDGKHQGLAEDMDKLGRSVGVLEQCMARYEGMLEGMFNHRSQVETA